MVCCSDFAGQVRGKGFPLVDLEKRRARGVGWVPTNIQITAFNSIADTPFGSLGDLLLVPDPQAEVKVDFGEGAAGEHFFLGDILHTDGRPWECCLRHCLKAALDALKEETGLSLLSAFELEFQFLDEAADYVTALAWTACAPRRPSARPSSARSGRPASSPTPFCGNGRRRSTR